MGLQADSIGQAEVVKRIGHVLASENLQLGANLEKLSAGRDNAIDLLRFLLAVLVIYSHSHPLLLLTSNRDEPFFIATGGQKSGGELAVDAFFILSGFLITRSWFSCRGLRDYLARRALRIYPGFLMAVVVTGLVAAPWRTADVAGYWRQFSLRDLTLGAMNLRLVIPDVGVTINGSLWTVRYEFLCYLFVAASGMLGLLGRRRFVLAAFLLCLGCYAGQLHMGLKMPGSRWMWIYGHPGEWPKFMSAFLAGAMAYLYRERIVFSRPLISVALVALALAVAVPSWRLLPLMVPLAGAYLLLFLAFQPGGRVSNFAKRGDLSYGLYLYAFPVQVLLIGWFKPVLTPITLFFAALAITLGLAFLSWSFVERPCLRLKRWSRTARATASTEDAFVRPGDPSLAVHPIG